MRDCTAGDDRGYRSGHGRPEAHHRAMQGNLAESDMGRLAEKNGHDASPEQVFTRMLNQHSLGQPEGQRRKS